MGRMAILAVLVVLSIAALFVAYMGWTATAPTELPGYIYALAAFGVVISMLIGSGLMALLFFSSRRGYDEPPELESDGKPR